MTLQKLRLSNYGNEIIAFFKICNFSRFFLDNANIFGNYLKDIVFIQNEKSVLFITNFFFDNNLVFSDEFLLVDSNISLENVSITNNYFPFQFLTFEDFTDSPFSLNIKNLILSNNTGNIFLYFHSISTQNIILKDIHIFLNNFEKDVFFFSGLASLNISNFSAINNVGRNLLFISGFYFVEVIDFLCLKNNDRKIENGNLSYRSCLYLSEIDLLTLNAVLIKECISMQYTPGIIMKNELKLNGQCDIQNLICNGNVFNPSNLIKLFGGTISITNVKSVIINQSWFYNNYLYLESKNSALIYFFSSMGNMSIINSYFQKNLVLQSSLTASVFASSFSFKNCYFGYLTPILLDQYSASLVVGSLFKLNVEDCFLEGIYSLNGFFILTDIKQTLINLDNLTLFNNFASISIGIYAGTETKNKIIQWKNSRLFQNQINDFSLLCSVNLYQQIEHFSINFKNIIVKDNLMIPDKIHTVFFMVWVNTKETTIAIEKCFFFNNQGFGDVFSIYGFIFPVDLFYRECIFSNNLMGGFFEGDTVILNFSKNIFVNNTLYVYSFMHGSRVSITLNESYIEAMQISLCYLYLTDSSNLIINNLIVRNATTVLNFFEVKAATFFSISNFTFENVFCPKIFRFVESIINLIDNFNVSNGNFINFIELKTTEIKRFRMHYLEKSLARF